ncbi:MAG: hypothetical protein M1511_09695 [Deltaproteobacteria bacterium]|nr:hypothetical protein [Deltaproteobacteria bacterium]
MNKPLEQISPTCDSSRRQIGPTAFIAPDRGKVIQPTAAPWVDTVKMSRNSAMIPTIGTFRDHQPLSRAILRHPPSPGVLPGANLRCPRWGRSDATKTMCPDEHRHLKSIQDPIALRESMGCQE